MQIKPKAIEFNVLCPFCHECMDFVLNESYKSGVTYRCYGCGKNCHITDYKK